MVVMVRNRDLERLIDRVFLDLKCAKKTKTDKIPILK